MPVLVNVLCLRVLEGGTTSKSEKSSSILVDSLGRSLSVPTLPFWHPKGRHADHRATVVGDTLVVLNKTAFVNVNDEHGGLVLGSDVAIASKAFWVFSLLTSAF
ncbi:hypothetical protein Tco_0163100 [Tanacetum coccineum]